jgi:hypothetical protein
MKPGGFTMATDKHRPMSENGDFTEKKASFSVRNLFFGGTALFSVGVASAAAYIDIKSDIKRGFDHQLALRCDVFEIRNIIRVEVSKLKVLPTPRECE